MRSGIVLAGTTVLDIVHMIDQWPDEEQIAFIRQTIEAPGGPPHNAAAGLVKLGAPFPVSMICVVGDDVAGSTFTRIAGELGLDTSGIIRTKGQRTDVTHVMTSKATGKRTFFFSPGATGTMTADQLLPADDSARIFYLGSPGISTSMDESDGWRSALKTARARGFKTCMELCPVPPDVQRAHTLPCLPLLDYFVINDSEAEILTGLPVSKNGRFDAGLSNAAAKALLERGVNDLVSIHHPEGAVALRKDGEAAFAPSSMCRRTKSSAPWAQVMHSIPACCLASTRAGRWNSASHSPMPALQPHSTRQRPLPASDPGATAWPMPPNAACAP
jgi:sugar/nucleoside kinase (ribokinase family)